VAPGECGYGAVNASTRLTDLVRARRDGTLARDEYWIAMRDLHRGLREYEQLVADAGLLAVEIAPSGLRLRLEGGALIGWDPDDLRAPPVVLLNEATYEPTEWSIVRALGGDARTVLDVGANIGWYTVRLAAHRGDRSGLHAFEPIASTYEQLTSNVQLNAFEQRVRTHPFGLSDRDEIVPFYVPRITGSVAASEQPLFDAEPQIITECRVRRLDDIAAEVPLADVDFIKCDIEGGEFGFLRGSESVLLRDRPTILLEMLRKWAKAFAYHPNDIIEWMKPRGYVCAAISEGSVSRVPSVTGATMETNFLFVHVDRMTAVTKLLTPEFSYVALD
jgi:FkbM family methyltransferase